MLDGTFGGREYINLPKVFQLNATVQGRLSARSGQVWVGPMFQQESRSLWVVVVPECKVEGGIVVAIGRLDIRACF